MVEHADAVVVRIHVCEVWPEIDRGVIMDRNLINSVFIVRDCRHPVLQIVRTAFAPSEWIETIQLHLNQISKWIVRILAMQMQMEAGHFVNNYQTVILLDFDDTLVFSWKNRVVFKDGRALRSNGKRHIGMVFLFDRQDIDAISGRNAAGFRRELPPQVPHSNKGRDGRFEVNTKRASVVPLSYFCPARFWDF